MLGKNDATLIAFDAPDAEDPVDLARHSMNFWLTTEDLPLPGYHYLGGRLGINAVAHQNGTVRFGADPATSALDLNCKLHDLDNLYVADSSFFVSSTAVNPALTIIANALRVGDVAQPLVTAHA